LKTPSNGSASKVAAFNLYADWANESLVLNEKVYDFGA
jgi:hypothetical protein